MALAPVPWCLISCAVASQVYPDPAAPGAERVVVIGNPVSLARAEWRIRSDLAAVRGQTADHAALLTDLGTVRYFRRKWGAADLDIWRGAYRLHAAHRTPNHPSAGSAAFNLAGVCRARGLYAEAERHYAIARRVDRANGRDDETDRAGRFHQLALLYEAAGKYAPAARCAHRAIQLWQAVGRRPWEYVMELRAVARVATRAGEAAVARAALDLARRAAPDDAGVKLDSARHLVAAGDDRAAGPLLRELLTAETARAWPHPLVRADIRILLAGVVAREGDADRGRLLLLTAIDAFERADGPRRPQYVDAVAEYERLFPDDRAAVAGHVAAIRAAAADEELIGPEAVSGERP